MSVASVRIEGRAEELLRGKNFAHVATLRADGSAQVAPTWIDVQDGRPVINTAEGRAWPRNLERDPRIFRLALDAMAIRAADAWYVGDMPGIDVVGARAAGLHPVLMDPYQFHLDADYARVSSLTELATMLRAASETAAH